MGLFSDPIVLSDDGGITTARSFTFRAQLNENGSVVGELVEPAALAAEKSVLRSKHSTSNAGVERHLFQRSCRALLPDALTYSPITVNFTVACSESMAKDTVKEQIFIALDGMSEATFQENFLNGLI